MMKCKYCGVEQPEEKFKAYTYKGVMHRMLMCNSCRSKRDFPRQDKTMKKLEKFSELDLVRALELRGFKVLIS